MDKESHTRHQTVGEQNNMEFSQILWSNCCFGSYRKRFTISEPDICEYVLSKTEDTTGRVIEEGLGEKCNGWQFGVISSLDSFFRQLIREKEGEKNIEEDAG